MSAAVLSLSVFASCETYKVGEPDTTAIAGIDGQYVAYAYEGGASDPTTLFTIQINNTAADDADKGWITITDADPNLFGSKNKNYLDAVRFKIDIDKAGMAFSCENADATEPNTCWNPYLAGNYGSYYTMAYTKKNFQNYKVSCKGKIAVGAVTGTNGNGIDAIEITSYSRTWPDGTVKTYTAKGQRNTGWDDEMAEYDEFLDELSE